MTNRKFKIGDLVQSSIKPKPHMVGEVAGYDKEGQNLIRWIGWDDLEPHTDDELMRARPEDVAGLAVPREPSPEGRRMRLLLQQAAAELGVDYDDNLKPAP